MEFPKTESNVLTFTGVLCDRLSGSAVFVDPPVNISDLRSKSTSVQTEMGRMADLKGQTEQVTEQKNGYLQGLSEDLKSVLSWAEVLADWDDALLKTIGWGGRKAAEPTQVPNAPSDLTILYEGDGSLSLKWKRPVLVVRAVPRSIMCWNGVNRTLRVCLAHGRKR